jgi:tRNA dimethylallyltransferase
MIEAGLVEETEKILCMGYDQNVKPLQSLGYKYIIRYIRKELTLEEAMKLMQRDTRHYARRQMTWFRGEGDIEWFHPDETGPIRLRIDRFLHGR